MRVASQGNALHAFFVRVSSQLLPMHSAEHSYLYDDFPPFQAEGSLSSTEHIDGTAVIHQGPGIASSPSVTPKKPCSEPDVLSSPEARRASLSSQSGSEDSCQAVQPPGKARPGAILDDPLSSGRLSIIRAQSPCLGPGPCLTFFPINLPGIITTGWKSDAWEPLEVPAFALSWRPAQSSVPQPNRFPDQCQPVSRQNSRVISRSKSSSLRLPFVREESSSALPYAVQSAVVNTGGGPRQSMYGPVYLGLLLEKEAEYPRGRNIN